MLEKGRKMIKFPELCVERPLGSKENSNIIKLLCNAFKDLNYQTIELPFECTVWHPDNHL